MRTNEITQGLVPEQRSGVGVGVEDGKSPGAHNLINRYQMEPERSKVDCHSTVGGRVLGFPKTHHGLRCLEVYYPNSTGGLFRGPGRKTSPHSPSRVTVLRWTVRPSSTPRFPVTSRSGGMGGPDTTRVCVPVSPCTPPSKTSCESRTNPSRSPLVSSPRQTSLRGKGKLGTDILYIYIRGLPMVILPLQ